MPQPHGGALNAGGTPGNKGGGRPTNAWKAALDAMREDEDALAHIRDALKAGPKGQSGGDFWRALEYVTDRTVGKPSQTKVLVGDPDRPVGLQVGVVHKYGKPE